MPTFIGYNTINQYKKFTLTDRDLIQRDLLNALTIRRGEMPGRPDVGSGIYDLMFEPQAYETQRAIELEVQRIIGLDPRIRADSINSYPQENGIPVISPTGKYWVKIRFMGKERLVEIDDRIPCSNSG